MLKGFFGIFIQQKKVWVRGVFPALNRFLNTEKPPVNHWVSATAVTKGKHPNEAKKYP